MTYYSSEKTIEKREVSLLAIFEVFISIFIYWSIAIYFDTYIHLLISILFTPLLLLKSKQSKEYALKYFFNWLDKDLDTIEGGTREKVVENLQNNKFKLITTLLLTILFTIFVINLISFHEENIFIFIGILFLLNLLILIASISISTIFGAKIGIFYGLISGTVVSSCLTLILPFFYQGILFGLASILSVMVLFWILTYIQSKLLLVYSGIGLLFPLVIVIFMLKFFSTIRFIVYGIKSFPQNWFIESFVVDFYKLPEILPDIEKANNPNNEHLQISNFLKKMKKSSLFGKCLYIIFDLFLFLPSVFLRISLKSTFWFYYPLILFVKTENLENNFYKTLAFLKEFSSTKISNIRVLFSVIIIVLIFLLNFDVWKFYNQNTEYFKFIFALLYVDYKGLNYLEYLQLLISFLTLVLYFWSDKLVVMIEGNKSFFVYEKQITLFQIINSIRNAVSFIYFSLFLLYVAVYFKIWTLWYIPNILSKIEILF